jgi:L-malate glycosyltransferase
LVHLLPGDAVLPFNGRTICLEANMGKRFSDWKSWRKLADIIHEFKPDVVQANAGDTLKYVVFSHMLFKWKSKLVFRNASMMSAYAKSFWVKRLNRFLLNQTDKIVSVSQSTAMDVIERFGQPSRKVEVIPVGIEELHPNRLKEFDNGKKNIVHVGGFTFEKNHEGLLRIYSMILKDVPDCLLWLVGDGPLRRQIQELVAAMGLSEKVVFAGFVPNAVDYILSTDVLVLPSIIEGLPSVILEAFQAETPVVAYNVGGIASVIDDNTGWLVPLHSESVFAKDVIALLKSTLDRRIDILYQAKKKVASGYLNKDVAKSFEQTYSVIQL